MHDARICPLIILATIFSLSSYRIYNYLHSTAEAFSSYTRIQYEDVNTDFCTGCWCSLVNSMESDVWNIAVIPYTAENSLSVRLILKHNHKQPTLSNAVTDFLNRSLMDFFGTFIERMNNNSSHMSSSIDKQGEWMNGGSKSSWTFSIIRWQKKTLLMLIFLSQKKVDRKECARKIM